MLAENLLLLALDDDKGSVHAEAAMGLPYGLAGALIMELALAKLIQIDDQRLRAVAGASSEHDILREAAATIAAKPDQDVRYWVERLDGELGGLKQRLLDGLVKQGTLEQREKRLLFVFRWDVYPERDHRPEEDARGRIEDVLFGGETGSPRTRLLIQLAAGCGVIDALYQDDRGKLAKARIEQLATQSDPCADAVHEIAKAAEAAQAAAMVAIMAASVAATTAATSAACASATSASCS